MRFLKIFLLGLIGLIVILFIISIFLPSSYYIERSIVIKAEPEDIFPYFDNLKKWPDWTVWNKTMDSTVVFNYEGPESGNGAISKWHSKNMGNGTITITNSRPVRELEYSLNMDEGKYKSVGKASFLIIKDGTKVSWSDNGELGFNPIARYFSYLFMDKYLGPDFEKGLANLKVLVEKMKANTQVPK